MGGEQGKLRATRSLLVVLGRRYGRPTGASRGGTRFAGTVSRGPRSGGTSSSISSQAANSLFRWFDSNSQAAAQLHSRRGLSGIVTMDA